MMKLTCEASARLLLGAWLLGRLTPTRASITWPDRLFSSNYSHISQSDQRDSEHGAPSLFAHLAAFVAYHWQQHQGQRRDIHKNILVVSIFWRMEWQLVSLSNIFSISSKPLSRSVFDYNYTFFWNSLWTVAPVIDLGLWPIPWWILQFSFKLNILTLA